MARRHCAGRVLRRSLNPKFIHPEQRCCSLYSGKNYCEPRPSSPGSMHSQFSSYWIYVCSAERLSCQKHYCRLLAPLLSAALSHVLLSTGQWRRWQRHAAAYSHQQEHCQNRPNWQTRLGQKWRRETEEKTIKMMMEQATIQLTSLTPSWAYRLLGLAQGQI